MISKVTLNRTLDSFFGTRDENIRVLESGLGVLMRLTSDAFEIEGDEAQVARAERIVQDYLNLVENGQRLPAADLNSYLRVLSADPGVTFKELVDSGKNRNFGKRTVVPKTVNHVYDDPDCSIALTREHVRAAPRLILSNSAGFGGINAALVFRRLE